LARDVECADRMKTSLRASTARVLRGSARLAPLGWVSSTWLAALGFWLLFGACVDTPLEPAPPIARLIAEWDPLACGQPHRVAIDLADDQGDVVSTSAPCAIGSVSIDMPHLGTYRGQAYAWDLDAATDDHTLDVVVDVTDPITRWQLPVVP
jgi:hypothetical protein